jgi:hypothetical protein
MAIDTAVKRNSVLAIATNLLPLPDNTIDQGDRQTLLRHYAGILAGAAEEILNKLQKMSIDIGISI